MDQPDPKSSQRAWKLATPLHDFIERRAAQQCQASIPGWPTNWTPQDASRGSHLRRQQWKAKQNTVQVSTLWDLVAGQIVGLGRMPDSNAHEFVSEAFWDGAEVKWQADTATSRDGRTVSEIRIMKEASAGPARIYRSSRSAIRKRKTKKPSGRAQRPPTIKVRRNKGGRPGARVEIRRVFWKLWDTRPGFRDLLVKQMIPEIRALVLDEERKNDDKAKNCNSSTIARVIGKERPKRRNRRKQSKPTKPG